MIDRALFAVAGLVAFCLSLTAPESPAAEQFDLGRSALDRSFPLPEALSLENRQTFFFSTSFGWMQPTRDFLPTFSSSQPRSVGLAKESGKNWIEREVDLRAPSRIHVGGEIGFLYGRSTGTYGFEYERGYVIGELGNEWFLLRVGTSYDRTKWNVPRGGR
jgi:hypothetical protein